MAATVCIYRIRHVESGACYVGQTVDFRKRKSSHLSALRAKRCTSPYLQHAYDAHGEASFVFEVLQESSLDRAARTQDEQLWIDTLKPAYNSAQAANSRAGTKASAETRARMSAAHKGNTNAAGKTMSAEERARRSLLMKGNQRAAGHRKSDDLLKRHSELMMGNQYASKGKKERETA